MAGRIVPMTGGVRRLYLCAGRATPVHAVVRIDRPTTDARSCLRAEVIEPFRRTVRERGAWHAAGVVALQVAILVVCVAGALLLGGVR